MYRDAHFAAAFPTGLAIGGAGGFQANFSSALSLSLGFDAADPDFCRSSTLLKDLVVAASSSPCFSWTVKEVLDEANKVLAGLSSSLSPQQANEAVSRINEAFVDGTTDRGYLRLP